MNAEDLLTDVVVNKLQNDIDDNDGIVVYMQIARLMEAYAEHKLNEQRAEEVQNNALKTSGIFGVFQHESYKCLGYFSDEKHANTFAEQNEFENVYVDEINVG